jgi:molybdenum-dependent DNA-binding transcriptional regulator ModE
MNYRIAWTAMANGEAVTGNEVVAATKRSEAQQSYIARLKSLGFTVVRITSCEKTTLPVGDVKA